MKKIWSLVFISMLSLMVSACSNSASKENSQLLESKATQNVVRPEVILEEHNTVDRENLSSAPMQCILLENGNIVRFFHNVFKEEESIPMVQIFDIYDTKKQEILVERDICEYQLMPIEIEYGVTEDGFYIRSDARSAFIVFDNNGEFQQEIAIPEETYAVCLSKDLTLMAYQDADFTEEGGEVVLRNLVDGTEEKVYQLEIGKGKVTMFEDFSFNKEKTKLIFKGQTNPVPEEQSLDCYGVLDLKTKKLTFEIQDEICLHGTESGMMISDKPRDPGEKGMGKVIRIDAETGERIEYSLENDKESEFVTVVDDSLFLTQLDTGDGREEIRIYEDGVCQKKLDYIYTEGNSGIRDIIYDKNNKLLYIEKYDMELLQYIVETIQVE